MSNNKEKKALLLRVGADMGSGHLLGSINENNDVHWIPIPGHEDPNWNELSYGDCYRDSDENKRKAPKISQLLNLKEDDLLVFYAGLNNSQGNKVICIVGYFILGNIYDMIELSVQKRKKLIKDKLFELSNPHLHDTFVDNPAIKNILILGKNGGRLIKGIKIGTFIKEERTYLMDKEFHYLGYKGSLLRAGSAHWINYGKVWDLLKNCNLYPKINLNSNK